MAILTNGKDGFGLKMIQALGLENQQVRSLKITMEPHDLVEVEATIYLQEENGNQLIEFLQPFHLERSDKPKILEKITLKLEPEEPKTSFWERVKGWWK